MSAKLVFVLLVCFMVVYVDASSTTTVMVQPSASASVGGNGTSTTPRSSAVRVGASVFSLLVFVRLLF